MENNIVNQVKSFFSEEVLERLSNSLGEPKDKLSEGVNASIPAVLLGLQSQSSTNLGGILEQVKQHFSNFDFSDWLHKNTGTASAHVVQDVDDKDAVNKDLLHTIFGNNLPNILQVFSSTLGLQGNTITKILSVSLPAIFSSLTSQGTNWHTSSISKLLDDQKDSILSSLPASLGLAAFGTQFAKIDTPTVPDPIPAAEVFTPPVRRDPPVSNNASYREGLPEESTSSGGGFWKFLVALAIIALLWFMFGKGCKGEDKVALTDTTAQEVVNDPIIVDPVKTERESLVVTLPSGKTLNAYKNGIEDQLVTFLKSDYKSLGEESLKNKWFDFDNLNFDLGTAKITTESIVQLENLTAILQEFPAAKIKIGGYTDKTGNEESNKKLSEERAEAVEDYLKSKNLGSQVDGAEGYGSQFAKYPASAPESERIFDRHVSVSVR